MKESKAFVKKTLKYIGRFIELFFAFLWIYLIISIYGAVIPMGELKDEGDISIFVRSNGVHTYLWLPTNSAYIDWKGFIPTDTYANKASFDYISFGWGDKVFFLETPTWAELKVSTALNAAFLPSSTAMHVYYGAKPVESNRTRKVYMDGKQYTRLINYVKKSFRLANDKVDLIEGKGYTDSDNFYEANNSYHLFRTCNIWTNEALKSANVKTGVFALFPDGILAHLKRYNE